MKKLGEGAEKGIQKPASRPRNACSGCSVVVELSFVRAWLQEQNEKGDAGREQAPFLHSGNFGRGVYKLRSK